MKELRYNIHNTIIRQNDTDSRIVEGYAIVFNSLSNDLGGFREIILPEAVAGLIERSDVLCVLNHNEDRGVLARSTNGNGSLELTVDEYGLKYRFTAPNTALGDELIESLKRGDITTSSFCFTVGEESWEMVDDTYIRTISAIENLYDVSPVYRPAYSDTSVALRSLEQYKTQNSTTQNIDMSLKKRNKRSEEELEKDEVIDEREEEVINDEEDEREEEVVEEETTDEEREEDECEETEEEREEEATDEEEVVEEKKKRSKTTTKKTIYRKNKMKKNFSLLRAINSVVNNRAFDEADKNVIETGIKQMRKSNLSFGGQIVLPVDAVKTEKREGSAIVAQTETFGAEAVATDLLNILEPLRSKSVLGHANWLTGLTGNVEIPKYSGSNCTWEDEIAPAKDGKGTFSKIALTPCRLTAYIDISKQFLLQDSVGAEAMLKADIVAALQEKLEKTVFGTEAGVVGKQPAGLFENVTADTAALDYPAVVAMEQALEEANIGGNISFVASPAAKAVLKTTPKAGAGDSVIAGIFLMNDNTTCEGYPVYSSTAVTSKGLILGNFDELVVAQWGGIDLTVDPYTQAANGAIRLVINAYFDVKARRDEAFVKKILA